MKNLIYLLLTFCCMVLQSCDTEIPESDTTNPTFSFRITGDGFDRTFTQDDDFSSMQLNLRNDVEYDVILGGADQDGVKLIQWQLPSENTIEFSNAINSPWTIRDLSFLSRMIEWRGDASAPITGFIFAGKFRPNGNLLTIDFGFYVLDYGGESGRSNEVSETLTVQIGNHNTEVISY